MDDILYGSLVIDGEFVHLEGGVEVRVDEAFGGVGGDLEEGELGNSLGLVGRHLLILMIEIIIFSIYIFNQFPTQPPYNIKDSMPIWKFDICSI